jgi:hypothetical protein
MKIFLILASVSIVLLFSSCGAKNADSTPDPAYLKENEVKADGYWLGRVPADLVKSSDSANDFCQNYSNTIVAIPALIVTGQVVQVWLSKTHPTGESRIGIISNWGSFTPDTQLGMDLSRGEPVRISLKNGIMDWLFLAGLNGKGYAGESYIRATAAEILSFFSLKENCQ